MELFFKNRKKQREFAKKKPYYKPHDHGPSEDVGRRWAITIERENTLDNNNFKL